MMVPCLEHPSNSRQRNKLDLQDARSHRMSSQLTCIYALPSLAVSPKVSDGRMPLPALVELALAFLALAFVLLIVPVLVFDVLNRVWRMRTLPPGPLGLPIFGSMFQVHEVMSNPKVLEQMVQGYGPIFTLWNGSIPTVIVVDSSIAREALVESGSGLSSRPTIQGGAMDALTNGFKTINSAPYGREWRSSRRNLVSGILHPAFISSFEKSIEDEVHQLVERLKNKCGSSCSVLMVAEEVRRTLLLIFIRMVFGSSSSSTVDVNEIDELLKEATLILRPKMSDHSSVLWCLDRLLRIFVPSDQQKRMQRFLARQEELLGGLIAKHRPKREAPDCYIDTLMAAALPDPVTLTREILLAGTETTTSCIEWALARVAEIARIQDNLFSDILRGAGERRRLVAADLPQVPYLRAVVHETLRRHPPVYVTAPHSTHRAATTLAGYEIPPDAVVFVHLQAIGNNPTAWQNPAEFAPERFTEYSPDFRQMDMIPFSAGRRICPGRHLGMLHVQLIVANLVRNFEWSPAAAAGAGGASIDLTPSAMGLSVNMKTRLRARIREREV